MKKTIPVIGMACSVCSAHVEKKLQSLEGVNSASVQRIVDKAALVFVPAVAATAFLTFLVWWIVGGNEALPQAILSVNSL